ncbi:MAG TPA: hypothetical protein VH482_04575 [Thermomicrobiales bacterium]|jgi:hypothetical protein
MLSQLGEIAEDFGAEIVKRRQDRLVQLAHVGACMTLNVLTHDAEAGSVPDHFAPELTSVHKVEPLGSVAALHRIPHAAKHDWHVLQWYGAGQEIDSVQTNENLDIQVTLFA